MKKSVPAVLRNVLIIALSIIIIVVALVMYWSWKNPGTITEKIPLYSYSQKAAVDYQVSYRPNILTGSALVGAGETYITKYLNNILTSFKYEFTGERPAKYKGQYNVTATLAGYTIIQEKTVTIWKKDYQLLPETTFDGSDVSFKLNFDLPLTLVPYINFVDTFRNETMINSDVSLLVRWNVEFEAETDKGVIKESLTPALIIPIGKNYFNITGEPKLEKNGTIEESVTKTLPVNRRLLYFAGTGLILLLAALIYLIFFTKGWRITDPRELKMKEILKKHGERLVALESKAPPMRDPAYPVKTLEDLIKIADELSKPVLYKLTEGQLPRFYVLDEPKIYTFELNLEPQKKTPDNTQITIQSTPL